MVSSQPQSVPAFAPAPIDDDPLGFMKQVQAERASQPLFEKVYLERKVESMKQLEQYELARSKYFLKHAEVLEGVEDGLHFKIKQAHDFFEESIQYYSGVLQVYRHFSRNLSKIGAFDRLRAERPEAMWYSSVENGIGKMLSVKDKTIEQSDDLQKWMQGTLVHRLREELNKFMQTVSSFSNEIDRMRVAAADYHKTCFSKLERMRKLMQQRTKFDLMSEQLELNELYLKFEHGVIEWGRLVSLFWVTAQKNEARLLTTFKHNTLEFIGELEKLYQPTTQMEELKEYWQRVELDHQPEFAYLWKNIIKPEHNEFIRRTLDRDASSVEDMFSFFKLEQLSRVVGSPEHIISMLSTKKFMVKVALNKGLKEWAAAYLYLTVDGWLVLQMEKDSAVRNHMLVSRLQNDRTAEQVVCVIERIKGIIFDSSNKEWLHFNRIDEVEQFLFLTESNLERKKAYLE